MLSFGQTLGVFSYVLSDLQVGEDLRGKPFSCEIGEIRDGGVLCFSMWNIYLFLSPAFGLWLLTCTCHIASLDYV